MDVTWGRLGKGQWSSEAKTRSCCAKVKGKIRPKICACTNPPQMIIVTKFEKPAKDTFSKNGPHESYIVKVTGPRSKVKLGKKYAHFQLPL